MAVCFVSLTCFKSVDEILWCCHSNKTSLAELLRVTVTIYPFLIKKKWNSCEVLQWPLWALKWLTVSNLPHHYPTLGKGKLPIECK